MAEKATRSSRSKGLGGGELSRKEEGNQEHPAAEPDMASTARDTGAQEQGEREPTIYSPI